MPTDDLVTLGALAMELRLSCTNPSIWYHHIEAWTKWPPFCRQHFTSIFLIENCCILIQVSLNCVLKSHGLAVNKRQTITWSDVNQSHVNQDLCRHILSLPPLIWKSISSQIAWIYPCQLFIIHLTLVRISPNEALDESIYFVSKTSLFYAPPIQWLCPSKFSQTHFIGKVF